MSTCDQHFRLTFPKTHRLRSQKDFDAVYSAGTARTVGPLRVFGRPNPLGHYRLGLSVSRRVGNAVQRNRVKRMLREAFRTLRRNLPGAYDVIVVVRPHEVLPLVAYQRLLKTAAERLHRHWQKNLKSED